MKDKLFILGAVAIVIILFVVLAPKEDSDPSTSTDPSTSEEPEFIGAARDTCVNHGGVSMHIHPNLSIFINDEQVVVPEMIGIDDLCMRALHTHETTGKIHIEYPEKHTFTLGDFFANWKQAYNKDRIFDYTVDDTHVIRMTVDGEESDEYEDLILEDLQDIVIYYEATE